MHTFAVSSVVLNTYKDVWSASINGTELPCEKDPRTGYALTVAMIEQSPSGQPTLSNVP